MIGTILADRYRLDELLGEGGMGKVYAAEHVLMKKRLAVKVLHRELTSVPEVIARFEREAMAAANIDHPNVAAATDFGKLDDGSVFLVLEFVQGRNLRDEIEAGPTPVERALHIGRQIALALAAAHALEIVHRDLKPENVMLIAKGSDADFVKVLDFGVAKVPFGSPGQPGPMTRAGMVFGTPEYMAPEQALGQSVDGRADLYALGVILYELLSGVRPYSSESTVGILAQQLSKTPVPFAERGVPGVPPVVENLVMRLLARDAGARFQSADELIAALNELLTPLPKRGARRFTLTSGSPGGGVVNPAPAAAPKADKPVAKPTFLPNDPLPAFTLPNLNASAAVQGDAAPSGSAPTQTPVASTVAHAPTERAEPLVGAQPVGKPTFVPGDPLPSFTFPPTTEGAGGLSAPAIVSQSGESAALANGDAPPNADPAGPLGSSSTAAAEVPAVSAPTALAPTPAPPGSFQERVVAVARPIGIRTRQLAGEGAAATRRVVVVACTWVDANRSSLPRWIRRPLRRVPAVAIVGSGAFLVLCVLVGLVFAMTGSSDKGGVASPAESASATPSAAAVVDSALQRRIDQAKKGGSAALERLSAELPDNPQVLLALAESAMHEGKASAAVGAIGKALSLAPETSRDERTATLLTEALRSSASDDAALALLEGPMGAEGAAVLFDATQSKHVPTKVRQRARAWIGTEAFRNAAGPALRISGALLTASKCTEKHALLDEAGKVGDARTLTYLKILAIPAGCGRRAKDDCYPCLRRDDALKRATAAIETRVGHAR